MQRPGHDLSWHAIRQRRFNEATTINTNKYSSTFLLANSSKSLLANITNIDDQSYIKAPCSSTGPLMTSNKPILSTMETNDGLLTCDMNLCRSDLRSIMSELRFLTDYVRKAEEDDDISLDWKFSAMVIDRFCLVLFTVMTTIFSYLTLFSAPNFFKLR
jgi:hypothetical protein